MITNFTGVKGDNFKGTCCATLTSGTGVKSVRFTAKEKIKLSKLQRLGIRLRLTFSFCIEWWDVKRKLLT